MDNENMQNIVKLTRTGHIYRIVNNVNGKCYVGQTTQVVADRYKQHVDAARNRSGKCKALEAAMNKYGPENFTIETLLACNEFELDSYEIAMIKQYDSLYDGYGYNLRDGGDGRMTKESIDRMIEGNIVKTQTKNLWIGDNLPKYVLKHREINRNNSMIEGYRVSDHPNGANKSFTNRSKYSMDELKKQAIEYKEKLDASPIYVVSKNSATKFIWCIKKVQYLVNKPGFEQKLFKDGNKLKNKADAEAYLLSLTN
jgi:group I intron endonuclease